MEQQFQLSSGIDGEARLSMAEMYSMSGEDRAWWMRRLEKLAEARNEQSKNTSLPHLPSMPHIPHISR